MQESEQLSQVIAEIYDTVLDRSLWPAALKKTTTFVQGQASAIYWNDAANNSGDVFFDDGGIAPEYRQRYFEKYVSLNPTLTPRCFTAIEEPAATADLGPYDEFLKTRFYREWAPVRGRSLREDTGGLARIATGDQRASHVTPWSVARIASDSTNSAPPIATVRQRATSGPSRRASQTDVACAAIAPSAQT